MPQNRVEKAVAAFSALLSAADTTTLEHEHAEELGQPFKGGMSIADIRAALVPMDRKVRDGVVQKVEVWTSRMKSLAPTA